MSLLIRMDNAERVLRSVGDAPNGTVGIAFPDNEPTWVIDSAWMPRELPAGQVTMEQRVVAAGIAESCTPITIEELVEGCEGAGEAYAVATMCAMTVATSAERFCPMMMFELLITTAELGIRTREALVAAGYMQPTQEDYG